MIATPLTEDLVPILVELGTVGALSTTLTHTSRSLPLACLMNNPHG